MSRPKIDPPPQLPSEKTNPREAAEKFLLNLPPEAMGVIITDQGAIALTDKTDIRTVVALCHMYLFEMLSGSRDAMRAMKTMLEKADAADRTEKTA
jgi:hypothetical protein